MRVLDEQVKAMRLTYQREQQGIAAGTAFPRRITRTLDLVIARREAGRRLPIARPDLLPQGNGSPYVECSTSGI